MSELVSAATDDRDPGPASPEGEALDASNSALKPVRYNANLLLISARLADEKRTSNRPPARRWWQTKG